MEEWTQNPRLNQALLMSRIIILAMVMGSFTLAIVVLSVQGQPMGQPGMLSYIALGGAVVNLISQAFIPSMMVQTTLRTSLDKGTITTSLNDEVTLSLLLNLFHTQLLIRNALLEGAAIFLIVTFLLEPNIVSLSAAGGLLGVMMLSLPSANHIREWLRVQEQNLQRNG